MATIWMVHQYANSPDLPGGTRQFEMARFLVAEGHRVVIIASDFNTELLQHAKSTERTFSRKETVDGVEWLWIYAPGYWSNGARRYVNIAAFCLNLLLRMLWTRDRPDIVIGSSPHLPTALTAMLLARKCGAKFYFEVRDLWPQALVDMAGKREDSLLIKMLRRQERLLYRRSDRVIVFAKGAVDYVVERGAQRSKVHWLPNSVVTSDFDIVARVEARGGLGLPPDRFVVIYAGAHGDANGLGALVDAAKILDQEHPGRFLVALVGAGPEKVALQRQGADVASLMFFDPVPKRDVAATLTAADALTIVLRNVPLFHYGVSPNKLYDYYAAGRPVVAAVGGDVNDEVEDHQLGVTARPEDARSIAESIVNLASLTPSERAAMGTRGRDLASSCYERSVVAQRLAVLIASDSDDLRRRDSSQLELVSDPVSKRVS